MKINKRIRRKVAKMVYERMYEQEFKQKNHVDMFEVTAVIVYGAPPRRPMKVYEDIYKFAYNQDWWYRKYKELK